MRTETITRNIYTAEELREASPDGFESALADYRNIWDERGYVLGEIGDSLHAVLDFVGTIHPDERQGYSSFVREMGDVCKFTGVCYDVDMAHEAADAMADGDDIDVIEQRLRDMQARLHMGEEWAAGEPDEFIEHASANNMEFYEDGTIVP